MCDRVYDAVVLFAVAWVTGYWAVSFLVLLGSMLVSYAKARAAMEVPVENNKWPDFMERAERSAVMVAGLILWGIFPETRLFDRNIMYWVMIFLIFGIYFTAFQRVIRAKNLITNRQ